MSGLVITFLIIWGIFTLLLLLWAIGAGMQIEELKTQKQVQIDQYNKLVREYNKLLGYYRKYKSRCVQLEQDVSDAYSFAKHEAPRSNKWPFNKEDTRALLALCHPDKHGNSKSATRITQMLLEMRP